MPARKIAALSPLPGVPKLTAFAMSTAPPSLARSLRIAAICAELSAVTTFLLWLLPRFQAPAASFEAALALHAEPIYLARLWVNFIHIFLALTAYGAAAFLLWSRTPILVGLGFVWFLLWGFAEVLGVSVNLIAVNGTWRAQFAAATPEVQAQLRTLLLGYRAVWDAFFFALLVGFLLGTLCYGLALWRGGGLERALSLAFLAAVPLTGIILLGGYTSFMALDPLVTFAYPILQPASRLLLGIWLWRTAGCAGGTALVPPADQT